MKIGRKEVGRENPTYFIADIASNHDGLLSRAIELVGLAAASGANAIKMQNFRAETLVSDIGFKHIGKQSHQKNWDGDVYKVYKDNEIPLEWTQFLKEECDRHNIDYMTTPYDINDIEYLSNFVCAFKVGSGDITYLELIERVAKYDKPLLIATGASSDEDVARAMECVGAVDNVVLMQCNTNYEGSPEAFKHLNLNVLRYWMEHDEEGIYGLSDHTFGHTAVLGAVALGARVVEKHFTDDNTRTGPDHAFSMNPATFMEMVVETRRLEAALGSGHKKVAENERETQVMQRRAIRAKVNIAQGQIFEERDLACLRPCPPGALPPYEIENLVGKIANRDIPAGEHLTYEDL